MPYITSEELKNNLDFYLDKASIEDVFVTENGRVVACITNPQLHALKTLDELPDIDSDISDDDAIAEALFKKHLK